MVGRQGLCLAAGSSSATPGAKQRSSYADGLVHNMKITLGLVVRASPVAYQAPPSPPGAG